MQSYIRKIKRGNIMPVFNIATAVFDFYRKAKNTGQYLLIGRSPYGNTNSIGKGPGLSYFRLKEIQKEGKEAMQNREKYLKK